MTKPKFKVIARPGVEVSPEYLAEVQEAFDKERLDYQFLLKYEATLANAFCWSDTKAGVNFWHTAHDLCTLELAEHTCECKWCGATIQSQ